MNAGDRLGDYVIVGSLGGGSMGEVYEALHPALGRHEAIKVLPARSASDRAFVERFLQEARTAANLEHPHIATVFRVSERNELHFYFAMELIDGGDLSDLIRERGEMDREEALLILRQTAEALDYAHDRGVVHRDIKPGNIMLKRDKAGDWCVKVVDFGIAKALESSGMTQVGMIMGTPEYMSPEQAGSGHAVTGRSDQYSLATIAYELLCGRTPFMPEQGTLSITLVNKHLNEIPPLPRGFNPTLPVEANRVLLKALSKIPEERYQSCGAFLDALSGAIRRPSTLSERLRDRLSNSRWLYATAAVTLAAGLSLVAWGLWPRAIVTPRVVGLSNEAAVRRLSDQGLGMRVTARRYDVVQPLNRVISQSPEDGRTMGSSREVAVMLSLGTRRDLAARMADEAYQTILTIEREAKRLQKDPPPARDVPRFVSNLRKACMQAADKAQEAIQADPSFVKGYLYRVRALRYAGEYALAWQLAQTAGTRFKDDVYLHDEQNLLRAKLHKTGPA